MIHAMKSVLTSIMLLFPMLGYTQNDVFDQSLEVARQLNEYLADGIASFLEYPDSHSNTLIVYNRVLTVKDACDEQLYSRSKMSNSILAQPKVQQYYTMIRNTKMLADAFDELLKPFCGYNSPGISQNKMNIILDPLFRAMGWNISILPIDCKDVYFYEYKTKNGKMMFIKNNLPPDTLYSLASNNVEVTFTYTHRPGGIYVVGGGLYRMIQFCDDENPHYYNVVQATSRHLR
jgi:hypothetical protein